MIFLQISRVISIAVIIIGLVVMSGWFTDDDSLKRLNPDWVTMKFSTATSFLMSGIILLLMNESRNKNSEFARMILFAPLIIVLFFMATFLVSTVLGTTSGVSQLFVKEQASTTLQSVKAGIPSVGTMINFLLIVGIGFTYLLTHTKHRKYLTVNGAIILSLAIIALIGYAIESPPMYYQVEGVSGAMALHTAIAFALLGITTILFVREEYKTGSVNKGKISIKISTKLVFFFLISAIIPIIAVGSISFDLAQTSLKEENFIKLDSIAELKIREIDAIFDSIKADTIIAQKYLNVRTNLPIISEYYEDSNRNEIPDYIDAKQALDSQFIGFIDEKKVMDDVILLDTNGVVVYNIQTRSSELFGKEFPFIDQTVLETAKTEQQFSRIFLDESYKSQATMFSLIGMYDFDDELIGFYVLEPNMETIFDFIEDRSGLGETGETLLAIKEGDHALFINPLRYAPDASFNLEIPLDNESRIPIAFAVQGENGAELTVDYRQKPIIAVWKYIPSLDWGMVTKIDQDEVFAPTAQLQTDITILAIVFMIGIGFFGIAASRTISNPLGRLREMAIKISEGDLDAKVIVQSTDEIGQLSKIMNETGEKLKNAQKEKEEFIAMITHDLKQPLVSISGNAEMLKNPKMGDLNEMQTDCVSEIQANAARQLAMIDNLVSAQKLGLGAMKYDIEELSTKDILNECIKTHSPAMTDKNIEYFDSSTVNVKIKGDKRRIQESFTNLILNAHDFVPQDGKIEVGINDGEKAVTFFVKDDGEGIPKEKQDQLFKKYGQVKSSAKRKFGGTGLGLAVSQQLTEGMGGRIWVESEEGKGSTFFFTIPKAD